MLLCERTVAGTQKVGYVSQAHCTLSVVLFLPSTTPADAGTVRLAATWHWHYSVSSCTEAVKKLATDQSYSSLLEGTDVN